MSRPSSKRSGHCEIPGQIEYEDDQCIVLRDINPQPLHLLIIPRKPIPRVGEATENQSALGHLLLKAGELAQTQSRERLRIVINNGSDGGETVPHYVHFSVVER